MTACGKVFLIGAGPGDPGLLTLKGAACLRQADLVLFDYLVNPRLLEHVPRNAVCEPLGVPGRGRTRSQADICREMIAAAKAGRTVVRLKSGDPMVFGRAREELAALDEAGLEIEIVPGITTALAASSYAGICVTDRDLASCVALVTAQEREGKTRSRVDWPSLAAFPGTLVVYMGVGSVSNWTAELIAGGKAGETPAAIIRHLSVPQQQTIRTTLSQIPAVVQTQGIRPPAIVIVGEVVSDQTMINWFVAKPLFGQRVLITRPPHQAVDFADRLFELGAQPVCQPAIEIAPPESWDEVDATLAELTNYDWLVFSSRNGVRYVFDRINDLQLDVRHLASVRIAAIGSATVAALQERGIRADLCPSEYRGEALAAALARDAPGKRFLLARASRGREILAERLRAAGAVVEQVVVYTSRDVPTPSREIADLMNDNQIDWTTVTSSAIARAIVQQFGDSLRKTRLAAISPLTGGVLETLGYPPDVVAEVYTTAGLTAAILNATSSNA